MMSRYYVHFNGAAVFVKEAEFFKSQGGLTEDWGKAWKWLEADGIEHARLLGEIHFKKAPVKMGGYDNHIYKI